jgi:nitrogen fixation NifU-like protein
VITHVAFEGAGCAISRASASLMTDAVKGKRVEEAERLFEQFRRMVVSSAADPVAAELGKLGVLCGVREFPARVKCASLAWHTLHAALVSKPEKVTTE